MQLHLAKQQFAGQMAISFESNLNDTLSMAKSVLVYDTVDTPEMLIKKVLAVTSEDLQDIANEILNPDKMSSLVYLNRK